MLNPIFSKMLNIYKTFFSVFCHRGKKGFSGFFQLLQYVSVAYLRRYRNGQYKPAASMAPAGRLQGSRVSILNSRERATTTPGWVPMTTGWASMPPRVGLCSSQVSVYSSRESLHDIRVHLCGARVTLHVSRVSTNGSMASLQDSRMSLFDTRMSLHGSRARLHDSRMSLYSSHVSFRIPVRASKTPRWASVLRS